MADLNYLNYLNLVGFVINVFVTFAASSIFGFPDNAELSDKYQTIVTPAGFTFAIWGIIFIAQGIFAVVQMLSAYRSHPLVQEGVSIWYFSACIFQSAWTFAFGYEVISLSLIFMGGILGSLLPIVINQSKIEVSEPSKENGDFWLLKFPFSIHCGWIAAAFAVNANVLVLATGAQAAAQESWAYVTLVYAVFIGVFALLYLSPPDFTIPSVLVWATMGISSELKNPKDSIVNTFSDEAVSRVRGSVIGLCVILACVTTIYGVFRVVRKRTTNTTRSNRDDEYIGDRFD